MILPILSYSKLNQITGNKSRDYPEIRPPTMSKVVNLTYLTLLSFSFTTQATTMQNNTAATQKTASKKRCARISIKVSKPPTKRVPATRTAQTAPKSTIAKVPPKRTIQVAPDPVVTKVPTKRTAQKSPRKQNIIEIPKVMNGLNPFELVMGNKDFFTHIQSFMDDESLYCKFYSLFDSNCKFLDKMVTTCKDFNRIVNSVDQDGVNRIRQFEFDRLMAKELPAVVVNINRLTRDVKGSTSTYCKSYTRMPNGAVVINCEKGDSKTRLVYLPNHRMPTEADDFLGSDCICGWCGLDFDCKGFFRIYKTHAEAKGNEEDDTTLLPRDKQGLRDLPEEKKGPSCDIDFNFQCGDEYSRRLWDILAGLNLLLMEDSLVRKKLFNSAITSPNVHDKQIYAMMIARDMPQRANIGSAVTTQFELCCELPKFLSRAAWLKFNDDLFDSRHLRPLIFSLEGILTYDLNTLKNVRDWNYLKTGFDFLTDLESMMKIDKFMRGELKPYSLLKEAETYIGKGSRDELAELHEVRKKRARLEIPK